MLLLHAGKFRVFESNKRDDGTIWWLPQSQVRGCENATIGRGKS